MAMPEIDSFVFKFKKLLHSGMNATLEIKSEAVLPHPPRPPNVAVIGVLQDERLLQLK